jgi:hypothetical protein
VVLPASVRESTPIPAVPVSNGAPVLRTAPLPPTPAPETVAGMEPRFRPARSNVALLVIVTLALPKAVMLAALTVRERREDSFGVG